MLSDGFLKKAMKFLGIEEAEDEQAEESYSEEFEEPVVKKIRIRKPTERIIRTIDGEGPL